jgi:hypothetical protein
VVAEGGATTGSIFENAVQVDQTVPLPSHSSVGSKSWLNGGIGHLGRPRDTAVLVRSTTIVHLQVYVRWATKHEIGLHHMLRERLRR